MIKVKMKDIQRQKHNRYITCIDSSEISGDIDKFIEVLKEKKQEAIDSGYTEPYIEIGYSDDCCEINFYGYQLETEQEALDRVRRQTEYDKYEEERELQEAKRLYEKYKDKL